MPVRIIATSFAFIAFTIAMICGLAAQNPGSTIISRALVAMMVCYALGLGIGILGKRTVEEHVEEYKKKYPVHPEEDEHQEGEAVSEADPSTESTESGDATTVEAA